MKQPEETIVPEKIRSIDILLFNKINFFCKFVNKYDFNLHNSIVLTNNVLIAKL